MSNWAEAIKARTKVTAVLITRETEWPADAKIDFGFDEVIVEPRCPHVYRRFELAARASNPVVYVQDDDCCIDIARLWRAYNGGLTHAITLGHRHIYEGTGVTLIGWGCFFPRAQAKALVREQAFWRLAFGDAVFEAEADRVFTYANRPHNTVVMPISQFQRPVKMCERPGHYQTKDRVIRQLQEMYEDRGRHRD